ncbi:hypothetical protein TNCV_4770531 [Trichonephila clavipes]|nr:hypothetical protein TNCV_4770531 [Trichonephila clavipes]
MTWSVAKSPRVAEQCDVNIHSLTDTYFIRRVIGLMHVKSSEAPSPHVGMVCGYRLRYSGDCGDVGAEFESGFLANISAPEPHSPSGPGSFDPSPSAPPVIIISCS